MKNYDYFHSQNREQTLPGYEGITAWQRGSQLTLTVQDTDISETFDRKDYDCDAQFKTEVERWAGLHS